MSNSTEIWKAIEGYEGFYEVSNFGRIRSLDREITYEAQGKIRKQTFKGMMRKVSVNPLGYNHIVLCLNSKTFCYYVHRLVAQAFIPNPDNKPEVNHKDKNPQNNHYLNLEWATSSENKQHAFSTGSTKAKKGRDHIQCKFGIEVIDSKGEIVATLFGEAEVRGFGLNPKTISNILKGKGKTHRGYTFRKIPKSEPISYRVLFDHLREVESKNPERLDDLIQISTGDGTVGIFKIYTDYRDSIFLESTAA